MAPSSLLTSPTTQGEPSTQTIDLTDASPAPPPMKRPYHHRGTTSFTNAYHRVISRQERQYNRRNPDLVHERVDIAEERRLHPAQDRVYDHISRAAAAIGYTHALLVIISSTILAALLVTLSVYVASDVNRKTRHQAAHLAATAAECAASAREHSCVQDGDHVSHPSHHMAALCKEWVACARRAAYATADARSAKIWAETLADIVNTFSERLSTTTLVITLVVLCLVTFVCTSTAANLFQQRSLLNRFPTPPHATQLHQPPLIGHSHLQQNPATTNRRAIAYHHDDISQADNHSTSSHRS